MGLKIEYGNAGYIETDYDASKSLLGHKEGSVGRLYDRRSTISYPGPYSPGYKLTNLLFSFPFKYPLAQAGEDPWLWPFDEWVKIITPRQVHISDFHSFHRLQYQNGNPMPVGDVSWGTPYFGPCRASETKYLYKIIGPGKSGTVNGMVGNLSKEVTYTFTHPNCKTNTTAGSGSTLGTNPKVIEVFNTIEVENGMIFWYQAFDHEQESQPKNQIYHLFAIYPNKGYFQFELLSLDQRMLIVYTQKKLQLHHYLIVPN